MKKVSANRDKIYEAAKLLRETVASTLGPRGYNVLIDRKMNIPMVTKDGVTVADNVESSDREINTIIKLIRSVASKMSSDLGCCPMIFTITVGRTTSVAPSGKPATARI